jgi:hypothetical protein
MTTEQERELPPLPDIEQEVYARCRRFLETDAQQAVAEIMREYAIASLTQESALLEATQSSLREHMRMAKVLLTQLQDLRNAAAKAMGDHPEIRAADAVIAHYVHPNGGLAAQPEPLA